MDRGPPPVGDEADIDTGEAERVAERDQLGRPLRRHDPGQSRHAEDVALREPPSPDGAKRRGLESEGGAGPGHPGGDGLGGDVDHSRLAFAVEMAEPARPQRPARRARVPRGSSGHATTRRTPEASGGTAAASAGRAGHGTKREGADYAERMSGMVDAMFAGSADTSLRASVKRQMMATPQRVAASAMRGMADGAIWRDDPIEVPLLAVMAGSRNWSADYVAYVKRLAPGVRYETMSGVGHFLMLERPAEFNAMLADFLRSQRVIR